MSAISASRTGYAIEGIMYEHDSDRAIKRHFHVLGQKTFHLGIGYIYGVNGTFDYLAGQSLSDLLLPQCHFIRKISKELGGPNIFEKVDVLNFTALSVKGIVKMISDWLASRL